jgi:uncharacterized protein YgiB involved in biofilm formation
MTDRPRRRGAVSLVAIGALPLALAACDGQDPSTGLRGFDSVEACIAATGLDLSCRDGFAQALQTHVSTAPAYLGRDACERAFGPGRCEPAPAPPTAEQQAAGQQAAVAEGLVPPAAGGAEASSGGGWFLPAMMGYMMGRSSSPTPYVYDRSGRPFAFSSGRAAAVPPAVVPPRPVPDLRPGPSGFARTDAPFRPAPATAAPRAGGSAPAAAPVASQRGGFGGIASARGVSSGG